VRTWPVEQRRFRSLIDVSRFSRRQKAPFFPKNTERNTNTQRRKTDPWFLVFLRSNGGLKRKSTPCPVCQHNFKPISGFTMETSTSSHTLHTQIFNFWRELKRARKILNPSKLYSKNDYMDRDGNWNGQEVRKRSFSSAIGFASALTHLSLSLESIHNAFIADVFYRWSRNFANNF